MTLMSGNIMLMPHGMCLVVQNLICKNAQALFQYFVVPHFIIMLQIVLHKHIWSLNHLFSFYEVYIKHHFFLKSIATNNLDVSIWQVYMIITLSPFRSCHVIQIFKWPHPHHRHIVKFWSNTAPSPSLSIDSTSRLRLCGWLMHTPPPLNSALNVRGINRSDLAKQTSAEMQSYE